MSNIVLSNGTSSQASAAVISMSREIQKSSGRKRWDKLAWVRNGLVYLWLTVGTMRDKPSHMKHPRLKADYAEYWKETNKGIEDLFKHLNH